MCSRGVAVRLPLFFMTLLHNRMLYNGWLISKYVTGRTVAEYDESQEVRLMKRVLSYALVLIAGFAGGVVTTRSIALSHAKAAFDRDLTAHSLTPVDLNGRLKNSVGYPRVLQIKNQRPELVR